MQPRHTRMQGSTSGLPLGWLSHKDGQREHYKSLPLAWWRAGSSVFVWRPEECEELQAQAAAGELDAHPLTTGTAYASGLHMQACHPSRGACACPVLLGRSFNSAPGGEDSADRGATPFA
jgi:hypothetical protein